MENKKYNVRDALPDTPDAFYDAVERSLAACRSEKRERTWGLGHLPRKLLIPLVAALVLLVAGTAVAAGVWLRDNYSPTSYMETAKEKREEQGKTIPDVEQAIASAAPKTGDYTFVMLPEFEDAQVLDDFRVQQGQPRYNETDWAWIKDIVPQVEEVLIDGRTLAFNIRLNTDHAQAFRWPDVEGQWVDALVDNMSFRKEGDSMTYPLWSSGGGVNPEMGTDSWATLYTDAILDQQDVNFPTEGRVELTVEIGLRDARVEDLAPIGNVAKLFYTFSFDAAAGTEVAPAVVTERQLSGSVVLTVDDWGDPAKPRMYNKRVSLDGVALKEEVRYRQTGIYMTYTVDKAPTDGNEALTNAILSPNREGKWYGLYMEYRIGQEGEWLPVGHENWGKFGENTVIVPIFPSEYGKAKEQGVTLRLTEYYGTALNGTPIAEDWTMDIPAGAMTLNFELAPQELGTYEIPLP
jgi:hypothetical protein